MTNTWTKNEFTDHTTRMERRTKMLEQRWIAVRDHQARLLAEAKAERLVRAARNGHSNEATVPAQAVALAMSEARAQVGHRLVTVAAGLSAEPRLSTCECTEA
jgi:hypothetical protein